MIEPFYFTERKLFGVYHSPSGHSDHLLVICQPFFDDFRRCYRSFAEFAQACAQKGIHVIRFDYYGTGDSLGDLEKINDVSQWIADVNDCIDEGLAMTGASRVTLLGTRFGATIAAQVVRPEVKRYVFWDPIVQGRDYVQMIAASDADREQRLAKMRRDYNIKNDPGSCEQFRMPDSLKKSWCTLDLLAKADKQLMCCVVSTQDPAVLGRLPNPVYTNFDYDWPEYHEGLFRSINVLDALITQVFA